MSNPAQPEAEGEPAPAPSRRRPFLAVPGWVLLLCLFLPTLRVCGTPTAPISFPPAYGVYLGAAVVAWIAGSRVLRTRQILFVVLGALLYVSLATFGALWLSDEDLGGGTAAGVAGFFALVGLVPAVLAALRRRWSERTIAIGCVVHAVLATVWNTLLVGDDERMWGAYVAFGASGAMLGASIAMLVAEQTALARRRAASQPAPLPIAKVVR